MRSSKSCLSNTVGNTRPRRLVLAFILWAISWILHLCGFWFRIAFRLLGSFLGRRGRAALNTDSFTPCDSFATFLYLKNSCFTFCIQSPASDHWYSFHLAFWFIRNPASKQSVNCRQLLWLKSIFRPSFLRNAMKFIYKGYKSYARNFVELLILFSAHVTEV